MNIFPPAARLRRFIASLCELLAGHMPRQPDPAPAFLVWQWLHRIAQRLDRLHTCLPGLQTLMPAPRQPDIQLWLPPFPSMPGIRPPQSRGWLAELSPAFAGQGEYLCQLLDDPQINALLQAEPRLHASLRRLLHLLDTKSSQLSYPARSDPAPPTARPPIPQPPILRPWRAPVREPCARPAGATALRVFPFGC